MGEGWRIYKSFLLRRWRGCGSVAAVERSCGGRVLRRLSGLCGVGDIGRQRIIAGELGRLDSGR